MTQGIAEASRNGAQQTFGMPRVSGRNVTVPILNRYSGTVNYVLVRHGSTIYEDNAEANGTNVTFVMPNGLAADTYSIVVWQATGDRAGLMSSFDIRLRTGFAAWGTANYRCGTTCAPGINCRKAMRTILAPNAVVYADRGMTRPVRTLRRYDRVLVEAGDDMVLQIEARLPTESTSIGIGPPIGRAPVIPNNPSTYTFEADRYRHVAGSVDVINGYIYAYTTRNSHSRTDEEIVQDVIAVALSRRGVHGLYNQSLRQSFYYLDCSAFVGWVFCVNDIVLPSNLAGFQTADMIAADVSVYSKHTAIELLDWGVGEIPEFQPGVTGDLDIAGVTVEDNLAINGACPGRYNGVYWFDETKVTGSQGDIQAGDTVSFRRANDLRYNTRVTWVEYGWETVTVRQYCKDCRPNGLPGAEGEEWLPNDKVCDFKNATNLTKTRRKNAEDEVYKYSQRAPCRAFDKTVQTRTDREWEITTLHVANSRPMGVYHIGLYIGKGFIIDGLAGGGDVISTGNFIHSSIPQVEHTNLNSRYAEDRIMHIGRPIDVPGWRR
jgi:hypothetical protein